MDELIYQVLNNYYASLEAKGYTKSSDAYKILILCFYKDFILQDYRGLLSKKDYFLIEKALDCLYGSTCLIPYPEYLKMNKSYLGHLSMDKSYLNQVNEVIHRIKKLEDTPVLKLMDVNDTVESDVMIVQSED